MSEPDATGTGGLGGAHVERLIGQLGDADHTLRYDASQALLALGSQALPLLIRALDHPNHDVRWEAVRILGKLDDPRAFDALIRTLAAHVDSSTRTHAAIFLGLRGNQRAVPPLRHALLHDREESVRRYAAGALARLKDREAAHLVMPDLESADPQARANTAMLLGELADTSAVEPLVHMLEAETDVLARRNAIRSLGFLHDARAVPVLSAVLLASGSSDEPWYERGYAATALGTIADSQAEPALIAALRDKDDTVRESAAYALGSFRDVRAREALLGALRDVYWEVRSAAALRLQHFVDSNVEDALIAALSDDSADVRSPATYSLGQLGSQRALPKLREMAEHDTGWTQDGSVKQDAARAIERILASQ